MATALPRMAGALRLPFQGRIPAPKSSSPAKVFTVHGTQQKRAITSPAFVYKSAFAQGLLAGYASRLMVARPTRIVCPSKTYASETLELPEETSRKAAPSKHIKLGAAMGAVGLVLLGAYISQEYSASCKYIMEHEVFKFATAVVAFLVTMVIGWVLAKTRNRDVPDSSELKERLSRHLNKRLMNVVSENAQLKSSVDEAKGKAKKAKKEASALEKKVAHLEGTAQQLNRELKDVKEKQLQYLNAMQKQTDTLEIALASLNPFPWASQQPSQRSGQQASDTSWMNRQEAQVLLKVVAMLLQQEGPSGGGGGLEGGGWDSWARQHRLLMEEEELLRADRALQVVQGPSSYNHGTTRTSARESRNNESGASSWSSSGNNVGQEQADNQKSAQVELTELDETISADEGDICVDEGRISVLAGLTVKQLREVAKQQKMKGYSKMTKANLIKLLCSTDFTLNG
eukprot:CAMPEP_0198223332 /NCGR_PEP_ID=MMETSP1445-20131203/92159_1 /TAXON_ID=36898 /ORGANISM="Pyramimonas sp., Strain CCMP2087" /LENGTH=457 /DNA_ID=CAMNT_0043902149 /DNA_START=147 /DNA_END=1520 /DNA_ORIENTATION=+